MTAFDKAWELLKTKGWHPDSQFGRCDFCGEDFCLIAGLPPHLTDDPENNMMCDVCWFNMNDQRVKEGLDITPFPTPNDAQRFMGGEGME